LRVVESKNNSIVDGRLRELRNRFSIVFGKKMVYQRLRDKKDVLHNYLTGFLIESLSYYEDKSDFKIIVDKFIMRKGKKG